MKIVLDALEKVRLELSPEAPQDEEAVRRDRNVRRLYVWLRVNEQHVTLLARRHPVAPFDDAVRFDEPTHRYTVDSMVHRNSMTSFVHAFFEEFNERVSIARITGSLRRAVDPSYRYFMKDAWEIAEEWRVNRTDASFRGTCMHAAIEYAYNGLQHELFADDTPQLAAELGVEYAMFRRFHAEHIVAERRLRPFRTELRVCDPSYELAGSVDMLYREARDGASPFELHMYDWKRSKQLRYEAFGTNDMGRGPVHALPNCNVSHYYLQLNGYRYLIERNTPYRVRSMYLAVFHPTHATLESRRERAARDGVPLDGVPPYLLVRVPDMQREVRAMCELRRYTMMRADARWWHAQLRDAHSRSEAPPQSPRWSPASRRALVESMRERWVHLERLVRCAIADCRREAAANGSGGGGGGGGGSAAYDYARPVHPPSYYAWLQARLQRVSASVATYVGAALELYGGASEAAAATTPMGLSGDDGAKRSLHQLCELWFCDEELGELLPTAACAEAVRGANFCELVCDHVAPEASAFAAPFIAVGGEGLGYVDAAAAPH